MEIEFKDVINSLPELFLQLLNQPKYTYHNLTRGKINSIFNTKDAVVPGVYLMREKDV